MRHRVGMHVVGMGLTTTLLVAAGCGTSSQYQASPKVVVHDSAKLVASTADATAKAKTAKVDIDASMSGGALPRAISFDMQGATAFDGSQADFTMNLGQLIPGAAGDKQVEVRLVDGVMYMDLSAMLGGIAQAIPGLGDAKWLKVDVGELSPTSEGSSPSSFTQYLDFLRGASKNGVETVGKERVRGVDTTHYHADIDWSRLADAAKDKVGSMSAQQRERLDKALQQMQTSAKPIAADVWIDDDGMTRRLEMRLPFDFAGAGDVAMKMRMDLYDFGTPLHVVAPPASDVAKLPSFGGLGGFDGPSDSTTS